jgi:aspartate/methionine/tyrosine aminotransferase
VTSAGVNALMLATQLLVDPGERVVEVVPLWPNLQEIPRILGAHVETVALEFRLRVGNWIWNVDSKLKPDTRRSISILPTTRPAGRSARENRSHPRALPPHGIWIFADDAYERLYYGGKAWPRPSWTSASRRPVISTNTFSKTWLMPGWRLGWLVVPAELTADLGKLIEYNTSCVPYSCSARDRRTERGRAGHRAHPARFRQGARFPGRELNAIDGISAAPSGTMYAFFRSMASRQSGILQAAGARCGPRAGARIGLRAEGKVRRLVFAAARTLAEGRRRLRSIWCTSGNAA